MGSTGRVTASKVEEEKCTINLHHLRYINTLHNDTTIRLTKQNKYHDRYGRLFVALYSRCYLSLHGYPTTLRVTISEVVVRRLAQLSYIHFQIYTVLGMATNC